MVLSRAAFGVRGNRLPSALSWLLTVGWETVLVILAINVVFGFVVPGIDWRAHFGGLITGAVLALAFAHAPRAHRALVSALACVAMLVVIIMMVAVRV